MKKLTIDVAGMHCKSCELLLEKSIRSVDHVEKVHASQSKGMVEISYDEKMPDEKAIESIIKESGYKIGKEVPPPWFHHNPRKYIEILLIALALYTLYMVAKMSGFSFGGFGSLASPTFTVAFLVGVTAGVSSCMALVGGLILGVSSKWNEEHIQASKWHRFEPHLYFNIGRVAGFGILGGLLGIFGSFVSLSPFAIGVLTVATGLIMLLLGVNLSELSPRLSRVSITLPKFLGSGVANNGSASKHIVALTTGGLTFFLPCGFTLAMQAYAITTGSFTTGALTMMAFALGTAPGLLGVGGLTSYLSGTFAKRFFKFTGVLVLLLAIFNISNGFTLMNLGGSTKVVPSTGVVSDEVQEIRMTESDGGYSPNVFHIKPNMKTRWIVNATNPYSCASQLTTPSIGVSKQLEQGENIIEFISPASGTIKFSCSMGMYSGKIIIDSAESDIQTSLTPSQATAVSDTPIEAAVSCPMTTGVRTSPPVKTTVAKTLINNTTPPVSQNETLSAVYTSDGMSPNELNLIYGKTYTLTIDVKDTIGGCMRQILIPGFDENIQNLEAGNKVTFTIKADKKGRFPLVCAAMGMPHGYLNIE
ncbi:MAG: sulfite exporter TauE/SafE family protein [Candidatus Gracilibacteria bacterium]|nr:sulfite exporter TauE/SafE family protein [Candidatus Gracilibacteria bacterium]